MKVEEYMVDQFMRTQRDKGTLEAIKHLLGHFHVAGDAGIEVYSPEPTKIPGLQYLPDDHWSKRPPL